MRGKADKNKGSCEIGRSKTTVRQWRKENRRETKVESNKGSVEGKREHKRGNTREKECVMSFGKENTKMT